MKKFDVVVIGSGPSGAMAAYELAQQGISVAILEKESLPRYKTCGGGLVFRGREMLPFDISSVVETEFKTIDIHFATKDLHIQTTREEPVISMVMRDTFDQLLVEKAVEKGAILLELHTVVGVEFGEEVTLETTQGKIQAKIVIAADGALSPMSKWAGFEESRTIIPALEYEIKVPEEDFKRLSQTVRFDIDAVPYGYGWCFPKKNHLSVGVGMLSKKNRKINLKAYYEAYAKSLGITTVLDEQAHGFVIPVSPRTSGFVKNNVFLVGDAAGFADPIVAEGLSNAMLSGKLAGIAIAEAQLNPKEAEKLYQQKLEANLLPEIKTGVTLAKLFYEKQMFRNLFVLKYCQVFAEAMTDLFMGKRTYPKDYKLAIRNKIKKIVFG